MKNLIVACQEAMDAFEGGDIGIDEIYPIAIRQKVSLLVEDINTLKNMAEEAK